MRLGVLGATILMVAFSGSLSPALPQTTSSEAVRRLADNGDAKMQYAYGADLIRRNDVIGGIGYLERSAAQGFADAQFLLGQFYFTGRFFPRDVTEGRRLLMAAADQGHADAAKLLGVAPGSGLQLGRSGSAAPSQQAPLSAQSATEPDEFPSKPLPSPDMIASSDAISAFAVGQKAFLANNYAQALSPLRDAVRLGHAEAGYVLALMHNEGLGVAKDAAQTQELLSVSAHRGFARAQDMLGGLYLKKGQANAASAAMWYERAAKSGFAEAQHNLAILYTTGLGVSRDPAKARRLLQLAAGQGHVQSRDLLAKLDAAPGSPPTTATPPRVVAQKGLPTGDIAIPADLYPAELRALHERPLSDSARVVVELTPRLKNVPASYLYEYARRVFEADTAAGFRWYWVAQIRARYEAQRCSDQSAHQGVAYLGALADNVIKAIAADRVAFAATINGALNEETLFPLVTNSYWICMHGIKAYAAAMTQQNMQNWLIPQADWPALRAKLRADAQAAAAKIIADAGAAKN